MTDEEREEAINNACMRLRFARDEDVREEAWRKLEELMKGKREHESGD